MLSIFRRRDALARGTPTSVWKIGRASSFVYKNDTVCYVEGLTLKVISLRTMRVGFTCPLRPLAGCQDDTSYLGAEVLSYDRPDAVVRIMINECADFVMYHMDVDNGLARHLPHRYFSNVTSIFSRQKDSHIVYGGFTTDGTSRRSWAIYHVDLRHQDTKLVMRLDPMAVELIGRLVISQPIELLAGEIGQTIAFEIHDGFFYAVTNQILGFRDDSTGLTYYRCLCFSLSQTTPYSVADFFIFRRVHAEGPIHDSWTELSLQVDESTNRLVIVEARCEWHVGAGGVSSTPRRTFYKTPIDISEGFGTLHSKQSKKNRDVYMYYPSKKKVPRKVLPGPLTELPHRQCEPHTEACWIPPPTGSDERHGADACGAFPFASETQFAISQTKFRGYSLSASTFVDVVAHRPVPETGQPHMACDCFVGSPLCLQLRTGTQRQTPFDGPDRGALRSMPVILYPRRAATPTGRRAVDVDVPLRRHARHCRYHSRRKPRAHLPTRPPPPPLPRQDVFGDLAARLDDRPDADIEVAGALDERGLALCVRGKGAAGGRTLGAPGGGADDEGELIFVDYGGPLYVRRDGGGAGEDGIGGRNGSGVGEKRALNGSGEGGAAVKRKKDG